MNRAWRLAVSVSRLHSRGTARAVSTGVAATDGFRRAPGGTGRVIVQNPPLVRDSACPHGWLATRDTTCTQPQSVPGLPLLRIHCSALWTDRHPGLPPSATPGVRPSPQPHPQIVPVRCRTIQLTRHEYPAYRDSQRNPQSPGQWTAPPCTAASESCPRSLHRSRRQHQRDVQAARGPTQVARAVALLHGTVRCTWLSRRSRRNSRRAPPSSTPDSGATSGKTVASPGLSSATSGEMRFPGEPEWQLSRHAGALDGNATDQQLRPPAHPSRVPNGVAG